VKQPSASPLGRHLPLLVMILIAAAYVLGATQNPVRADDQTNTQLLREIAQSQRALAEAAHTQAEAARSQAEAARSQAESLRDIARAAERCK
jgi:hypothetical protein